MAKSCADVARHPHEDLFRILVEGVEDYAIFMLDPAGNVATWNVGAERIKGYRANEILGRSFAVFYPMADRARKKPERALETAAREGRCEDEGLRVRKDGSTFDAHVVITALRDDAGRLLGFAKVTRDVTARKRAEENARALAAAQAARDEAERAKAELQATEERYRRIVETAAEGVCMIDAQGTITFVNARMAQMLGYEHDELLGRALDTLVRDGARDDGPFRERRAARFDSDVCFTRKSGGELWALVATSPILDAHGAYAGALAMVTDITDRKRAENALRVLVDASAILSVSLDYETTLKNLARFLVPRHADWCAVEIDERDGTPRSVAVAHVDPEKAELGRRLRERFPPRADAPHGVAHVLRTGESELYPEVTDELLASSSMEPERLALVRQLGMRSVMIVPLKARGRTLGALTLVSSDPTRRYDTHDLELLEEAANRAALAVDTARLHRDLEAQSVRLRVLAEASRVFADTGLGLSPVVDGIARHLANEVADSVVVRLREGDRGPLVARAVAHVDRALEPELCAMASACDGSDGILAEVARTGRSILLPALDLEEQLRELPAAYAPFARRGRLGSVLVVPLRAHGRAIGTLGVARGASRRPFGDHDRRLLEEVGDRAAMAIESARRFDAEQRSNERLRILAEASSVLTSSLDYQTTLKNLARVCLKTLADACVVDVYGEDDAPDDVAVAHVDPAKEALLTKLRSLYGQAKCAPNVKPSAAILVSELTDEELRPISPTDEQRALVRAIGVTSVVIAPLVARGIAIGVLALGRSTRPAFDDDDRSLAEELARRAALAVDNARLFGQSRAAIALRDDFLAIASHELNTPLTPLSIQLETLRRTSYPPEKTAAKLDSAMRQVVRIKKLVSQLLDVSRVTQGRLHLELEPVDLGALAADVAARVADEARRAGSAITLHAEEGVVGAWDRLRMDQVIENVLSNAIKYGQGKPIEVSVRRSGDVATLTVSDHGIGIEPESQARIFQRFERAVSTRHYGGFGLGLWIVRQIVDASGGKIAVESRPGAGSTFVIELPLELHARGEGSGAPEVPGEGGRA